MSQLYLNLLKPAASWWFPGGKKCSWYHEAPVRISWQSMKSLDDTLHRIWYKHVLPRYRNHIVSTSHYSEMCYLHLYITHQPKNIYEISSLFYKAIDRYRFLLLVMPLDNIGVRQLTPKNIQGTSYCNIYPATSSNADQFKIRNTGYTPCIRHRYL